MTGLNLYDCVKGRKLEVLVDDKWVPMTVGTIRIYYNELSDGKHPYLSIVMIPLDHEQPVPLEKLVDKVYHRQPHELRFPAKPSDIPLVVPGRLTPKVFAAARKGGAS